MTTEYNRLLSKVGHDRIKNCFLQAHIESRSLTYQELSEIFDKEFRNWMQFRVGDYLIGHDQLYERLHYEQIYDQWLDMSRIQDCAIHTGLMQGNYPYANIEVYSREKGRLIKEKLKLHQVLYLIEHPEDTLWERNKHVASHPCNIPSCIGCAVKASRYENNHRSFCMAFILVNDELQRLCKHNPPCKKSGDNAFATF